MDPGPGKIVGRGIAVLSQGLDPDPAGVAQGHELGHLVEGLPGGVVPAAAQQRHLREAVHPVEVGVAAGDHQGHEGERRHGFQQKCRHDVGLQMVDAHQGFS